MRPYHQDGLEVLRVPRHSPGSTFFQSYGSDTLTMNDFMPRDIFTRVLFFFVAMSLTLGCSKNPSEATPESLCDLGKGIYGGTQEVFYKGVCLEEVQAFQQESDKETFIAFATCVHDSVSRADFRVCAKNLHQERVKVKASKMAAMLKSVGEKYCECQAFEKKRDEQGLRTCKIEQKKLKKQAGDEVEGMRERNTESEQWQLGKPMSDEEILFVMKAARDARKAADKACKETLD